MDNSNKIQISSSTAFICQKLIRAQIEALKICNGENKNLIKRLLRAEKELSGEYELENSLKEIMEGLKKWI